MKASERTIQQLHRATTFLHKNSVLSTPPPVVFTLLFMLTLCKKGRLQGGLNKYGPWFYDLFLFSQNKVERNITSLRIKLYKMYISGLWIMEQRVDCDDILHERFPTRPSDLVNISPLNHDQRRFVL